MFYEKMVHEEWEYNFLSHFRETPVSCLLILCSESSKKSSKLYFADHIKSDMPKKTCKDLPALKATP